MTDSFEPFISNRFEEAFIALRYLYKRGKDIDRTFSIETLFRIRPNQDTPSGLRDLRQCH